MPIIVVTLDDDDDELVVVSTTVATRQPAPDTGEYLSFDSLVIGRT